MKARELRIGNLILLNGKVTVVEGLTESKLNPVTYTDSHYGNISTYEDEDGVFEKDDIKGIPITEQWLEKFGFKKLSWIEDGRVGFDKNNVIVYLPKKEFGHMEHTVSYHETNDSTIRGTDILFIHQLQNLYFALTGEELEWKS